MHLKHLFLLVLPLAHCQLSAQQAAAPVAQVHPVAFATAEGFAKIKPSIGHSSALDVSFQEAKRMVDPWLGKVIDVPVPKDPAGGYSHEQHKFNYTVMYQAGVLYQLTGNSAYAILVRDLFLRYAQLNPGLKNHPEATSSSPGRIFWQALNDANWLVYTGLAYDCIQDILTSAEKEIIVHRAFQPIVQYITKDLQGWFDLIHNHAVWACAGVGIVGIATDNQQYVDMALYGSRKDSTAGFLAQMRGLFSPNGYYNEGPYYTRYAILPFYVFAQALQNTRPSLGIFQYRNQLLLKALEGALQQTNLNGAFFSYNDALKDKTYTSSELVVAMGIAWQVYGAQPGWLPVAKAQGKVLLNAGGAGISVALDTTKKIAPYFPYKTIEFTDGALGNKGGVSVLRAGKGAQLTSLIFKYSSHGMSHGHFDKLNVQLFDNGNEVLQDYGAARFIGIEQKWGGRYLPETKNYAQQTIAHNTVTVDETSHYKGVEAESEKHWPVKLFGSVQSKNLQVVAAADKTAYPGMELRRALYMVQLPQTSKPLILDLFKIWGNAGEHQFDLPFHYSGNVISTNYPYQAATQVQTTLGKKNGYQFLFKEAEAWVKAPMAQFTYLNGPAFYTISSWVKDSLQVFFTRTGANDPNFNLRREPGYVLRQKGSSPLFFNVIELHGQYSTVSETANGAYSKVKGIKVLTDDDVQTVIEIDLGKDRLHLLQVHQPIKENQAQQYKVGDLSFQWKGAFAVFFNQVQIQ